MNSFFGIPTEFSLPHLIFQFDFYYPLIMAWMWMIGALIFFIRYETPRPPLPRMKKSPGCSILIPCFNEEAHVRSTIYYALATRYPDFDVIAMNDGSSDQTGAILDELALREPRLRVVHLETNQGKAIALRTGAISSRHEYLICIDGDALLHPEAVHWIMHHLTRYPHVGAVTGNPRILTRSTLLGRIQVGEFSSIIGLIKRAQSTLGQIFTVSGVIAGFRRTALHDVGYWNEDMITEDIDISWRLQIAHWAIHYEPAAMCYIYMPETLRGLWGQRLRWAQGGVEVLLRHFSSILHWRQRLFWPIAIEYMLSLIWSYSILFILVLFVYGVFFPVAPEWYINNLLPQWYGLLLGMTCLIQFFISLWMDRHYEDGRFLRNYVWIIWYPMLYWILSLATTVVAIPKTLLKSRGKRARWISPDRGIKSLEN